MQKYYYSDPLKAAWMATNHGFRLYIGTLENDDFDAYGAANALHLVDDWNYRNGPRWRGDHNVGVKACSRVEVHPDSEALFTPRQGDLLLTGDGRPVRVIRDSDFKVGCISLAVAIRNVGTAAEIIQRDGKAFFAPEC